MTGDALLDPGQTWHLPLGAKARMLATALRQGLPVPPFRVLPEETLGAWLAGGIVAEDSGVFTVWNPQRFGALLAGVGSDKLAVRSAFSMEDGVTESLAGRFETVLDVPGSDPSALAAALCRVWSSAARVPGIPRRDALLMRMVDARHAGVAFLERDHPADLVNATDGLGDAVVGGQTAAERCELPPWSRWPSGGEALVPWQQRLQRLLHRVRSCFGHGDWDVEWADDGQTCWLLQVRPITRPTVRNELFTMANHREILPDPPSVFMTSLIGQCAHGLFGYYRRFDARLPRGRAFIEVLHGRPLINLSLLLDMMRLWGLPSRLVTDSIGGGAAEDIPAVGLHPVRLLRSAPVLIRQGLDQLRAPHRVPATIRRLVAIAGEPLPAREKASDGTQLALLAERAATVYTLLVREMFALTAAISGPTAILRRAGLLAAFSRRHRTVSTAMHDDLETVARTVDQSPGARQQLEEGEVPGSEPFATAWRRWLRAYGHRGVYESDFAMPRFHEHPETLIPALLATATPVSARPRLPWHAILFWLPWMQARQALDARERLRAGAMQAFDRLRQQMLREAARLVAQGLIPAVENVWQLTVEEWAQLDAGWQPDVAFWRKRATEEERRRAQSVPDVVRRFGEAPHAGDGNPDGRSIWSGIGLTRGSVSGQAWVLRQPEAKLPDGFDPSRTVLIARAVDAGWIPTFRLVAGVAVEIGGDLSHGSIILRELGLPAATNLPGITASLANGDPVQLNATEGQLERLEPAGK